MGKKRIARKLPRTSPSCYKKADREVFKIKILGLYGSFFVSRKRINKGH